VRLIAALIATIATAQKRNVQDMRGDEEARPENAGGGFQSWRGVSPRKQTQDARTEKDKTDLPPMFPAIRRYQRDRSHGGRHQEKQRLQFLRYADHGSESGYR
jgi:hypothetical protein